MIARRLTILLILGTFFATPVFAQGPHHETENFRQVMFDIMESIERAVGADPSASMAISDSSYEEIEVLFGLLHNEEQFFEAAQNILTNLESTNNRRSATVQTATQTILESNAVQTFPPDYPPDSCEYKTVVLDTLRSLGFISETDNRCNTCMVADYYTVYYQLAEALANAEGDCDVARCDPTGADCETICGAVAVAKIAVQTAAMPLELCAAHNANVDSAEIEAAYENGVSMVNDLDAHDANIDSDLALHDEKIQNQLGKHDEDIKAQLLAIQEELSLQRGLIETVLANQQEIMELLKTPQGRRPGWNNNTILRNNNTTFLNNLRNR